MARYVGDVGRLRKYWEANVVGDVLVIDEGTVGTLGKRTRVACEAPQEELEKRAKQKRAKGYAPADTAPTRDALLAAFAPHGVEATDGDPGRARDKALAALGGGEMATLAAAHTALQLARRGSAEEARAVLAGVDARAAGPDSAQRAALLAVRAAAALALGERDAAGAGLTCALAMMAFRAGAPWSHVHGSEGVEAAAALLDLGRDDDARRIYEASGYVALDAMLARGRLAWFDAALPKVVKDVVGRDHFALRRAHADGGDAFADSFVRLASQLPGGRTSDDQQRGLVALAAAAREFGPALPARGAAMGEALRNAASRVLVASPYLLEGYPVWLPLAAAADLGADIGGEIALAQSPLQMAAAVTFLLPNCRVESVQVAAAARVPSLLDAHTSVDPLRFAEALAAWVRRGGQVDAALLRATAARAGKGYLALGALAGVALLQGDRDLTWEVLALVPKNHLASAAGVARRSVVAGGALDAYKTLADAIPPWGEYDLREESRLIARAPSHGAGRAGGATAGGR